MQFQQDKTCPCAHSDEMGKSPPPHLPHFQEAKMGEEKLWRHFQEAKKGEEKLWRHFQEAKMGEEKLWRHFQEAKKREEKIWQHFKKRKWEDHIYSVLEKCW